MDNYTIERCIHKDIELRQTFGGCLLEDDVRHIVGASTGDDLTRLHNLRIFLCNTVLHRQIEHFPLAFILNTGTHRNGGIHWQALYIDHEHIAYFFDSYGRKPSDIFRAFAHELLTVSYYREFTRKLPLRQALSDSKFTPTNLRRSLRTKLSNDAEDTVRYFPYQIQSDTSHVCGEYSVLFLHNIARSPDPWLNAYEFWIRNQDVFFLLPTNRGNNNNEQCVACCNTERTTKENTPSSRGDKKTTYQKHRLQENDSIVQDIFSKLYNIYLPSSLL